MGQIHNFLGGLVVSLIQELQNRAEKNKFPSSSPEFTPKKTISQEISSPAANSAFRYSEISLLEKIPCKICGGKFFWETIYLDGELRCIACEPPPSRELVGWIVGRNSDGSWQDRKPHGAGAHREAPQRREDAPDCPTLAESAAGGEDGGEGRGEALATDPDRPATDPDLFVHLTLADGRQAYARRGWDNPRSPWFSQRLCMAVGLSRAAGVDEEGGPVAAVDGFEQADWLLDRVQGELRAEIVAKDAARDAAAEIAAKSVDTSPQMKRITDAGASNTGILNTPR